jgi:hypothetical protein
VENSRAKKFITPVWERLVMVKQLAHYQRVFIFDPCFGEMTGHWENYCRRMYDEIAERNCFVKVFGQKNYLNSIIQDIRFEPTFGQPPFGDFTDVFDFYRRSVPFLQDLKNLDEGEFRDGDLFIFHSIYPHTFAAILDWTQDVLKRKKILTTIFFQLPPSETIVRKRSLKQKITELFTRTLSGKKSKQEFEWVDSNYVRFYQINAQRIQALIAKGTHVLYANTNVLVRNFAIMLAAPVNYVPMPGPIRKNTTPVKVDNYIRVGYFGHSSTSKGGQFLQYVVEKTLSVRKNVKFILHINPNPETAAALEFFKTFQHPDVTCYFGHIEPDTMMSLMAQVDVVLMPYCPVKYATTPSAVFSEAMPLHKIFIIPQKTWIFQEALKYNPGYVAFKRYSHDGIYSALNKALNNFKTLQDKSYVAGEKFYQENNISHYVDVFAKVIQHNQGEANEVF